MPRRRGVLELEPLADGAQLELGVRGQVAQPLGGDLGDGDRLALRAQPGLDVGLLSGAGAQLGSHLLAGGAVAGELALELGDPLGDGLPKAVQRCGEPLCQWRERGVGGKLGAQTLQTRNALGVFACDALSLAALRGELALQLGATHRERALVGGGAALLDQPGGVALLLERTGVVARGLTQRALGLFVSSVGVAAVGLRAPGGGACGVLGGGGSLGRVEQLLTLVAAGEHALGAALGHLAHFAGGGEPHAPAGGDGEAGEVLGKVLQTLHDPRVGEQPPREGEHGRRPVHELEQGARARRGGCERSRRGGARARPQRRASSAVAPSGPARSSRATARARSGTSAASRRPPSAAASASS